MFVCPHWLLLKQCRYFDESFAQISWHLMRSFTFIMIEIRGSSPVFAVWLCVAGTHVQTLALYLDTQNKMKPGVCKNVLQRRRLLDIFYRSLVLVVRTKCASQVWCRDVPVGITRSVPCWITRSDCPVLVRMLSLNSRGHRSTPSIWLLWILLFTCAVDISVPIVVSSRSWSFWSKHVEVWTTVNICGMLVVLHWIHLILRYRTCPKIKGGACPCCLWLLFGTHSGVLLILWRGLNVANCFTSQ